MISEPILDVSRLLESACCERFDPILSGGSSQGCDTYFPSGTKFDIRWQAGVHEPLRLTHRPFVKLSNSSCESIYIIVQLGIGQGPIDVPVGLRLVRFDIFGTQKH